MAWSEDRPSALLTQKQRKVLEGEMEGLSDAARWKHYERIRDRLEATIYDFGLLYDNWDEVNLEKVAQREPRDRGEFSHALVGLLATVYWLEFPQGEFEYLLKRGVMLAEEDRNDRAVNPRFRLQGTDSKAHSMQQLAKQIERFEGEENAPDIRIGELRSFAEAIAYSDVDAADAVRQGYHRAFGLDDEGSDEESTEQGENE